jgi:hypothetical protein
MESVRRLYSGRNRGSNARRTMSEYHKINSIFKRDETGKRMLFGEYAQPEFAYLADNEWVFTEKVDGTNIRVIVADGKINFGGKTDNAQIPAKLFARLTERFVPATLATKFPDGAVLYGEGFGPGIQSGGLYRKDQDFVLFDVRVGSMWLQREDIAEIASHLGIEIVPICGSGTLVEMVKIVEGKFSSVWGDFPAEGIVARPKVELQTRRGDRIITKLKFKDFK